MNEYELSNSWFTPQMAQPGLSQELILISLVDGRVTGTLAEADQKQSSLEVYKHAIMGF